MDDLAITLDRLEDTNILAWIFKHKIKNERGLPITFDDHAFMIDPYLDWTPEQGSRKASQCGWSVMTNIKLVWAANFGIPGFDVPAANVIYTLPSDSDVNAFVPSKTNMIINNNPIMKSYMSGDDAGSKEVDSISKKQIGQSFIYFKGTQSKTAALMLTADLRIHDEADRSNASVIDQYESRVATSKYRGNWQFSNPSAPNMPADLLYQQSDQKHWFVKCTACGAWQYLDWYKLSEFTLQYSESDPHCFVDDINGTYVCGRCGRNLSDECRRRGKWVKKNRLSKVSGYWVSHMMYPWLSASSLVNTEKRKSKDYFMNFVMGKPYVGSDVVVDAQTIVNNIVLSGNFEFIPGKVAMGVDNGDIKHYVIGDEKGIWLIGKTRDWNDIELLIQKFQPVCVIDLNPYPNKPRELAAKYKPTGDKKWRVYCSFYIEQSKNYELIDWGDMQSGEGYADKLHMVYPVRNMLFDDLIAHIASGGVKFFKSKPYWEEYIKHWETMYRADRIGTRMAKDVAPAAASSQIVRGVWESSTGEDHYCHATLYYYVALSRMLKAGGAVLSKGTDINTIIQQAGGNLQRNVPITLAENLITPSMPIIQNSISKLMRKPQKGVDGARSRKM